MRPQRRRPDRRGEPSARDVNADGAQAVTEGKLADRAVTSAKIASSAVGTGQLAAGERSEGFSKTPLGGGGTSLGATESTVASLSLPAGGHYLVTAETGIAGAGAVNTAAVCSLRDDGADIAVGGRTALASGQISGSITLTGVSDGGTVNLVCSAAAAATTISKNQVITATRVNSVTQ